MEDAEASSALTQIRVRLAATGNTSSITTAYLRCVLRYRVAFKPPNQFLEFNLAIHNPNPYRAPEDRHYSESKCTKLHCLSIALLVQLHCLFSCTACSVALLVQLHCLFNCTACSIALLRLTTRESAHQLSAFCTESLAKSWAEAQSNHQNSAIEQAVQLSKQCNYASILQIGKCR